MKEKKTVNEEKMSALMNSTVAGVNASDQLRHRAMAIEATAVQRPIKSRRWVYGLATAAALAAFGLIAMYPKSSEASAFKRMQNAISNATSMHVDVFVGKSMYQQVYYQNRGWLMHSRLGSSQPTWALVSNDQFYKWDEGQTVATLEPYAEPVWMAHDGTAIDFVESQISFDESGVTVKQVPHTDVNGRPTYELDIERRSDPRLASPDERCEIVVDKQTDLPITATIDSKTPDGGDSASTENFVFNSPLPDSMFKPVSGHATEIRNLPLERKTLKASWANTLAIATSGSKFSCEVRDVEVNVSGVVFMAYSGSLGDAVLGNSTAFAPTELSDQNGTIYLRISDYKPGSISSFADDLAPAMAFGSHQLGFAAWAPLAPQQVTTPLALKVAFQVRTYTMRQDATIKTSGSPVTISVKAKPFAGDYPAYSVPLWLRYWNDQMPDRIAAARAAYMKNHRA